MLAPLRRAAAAPRRAAHLLRGARAVSSARERELTHDLLRWLDPREDSGFRGYFVSGRRAQDLEALVNHYTAPALARALRDREEILATCAAIVSNGGHGAVAEAQAEELRELLLPFAELPQSPAMEASTTHGLSESMGDAAPRASVLDEYADKVLQDESRYVLPDYRSGGLFHPDVLNRLRTRLHRLPREISSRARRRASVILPLCHVRGVPSVLFTVRSTNVNRHKGEVCFPGGMVDDKDQNVVEAGLRELHEEVGIHQDVVDVLGVLRCDWSEVKSITGIAVTPIVGYLGAFEELELDLDPGEVGSSFTVPVAALLKQENWVLREYSPPVFRQTGTPEQHVIWGLTGYILHRFMRLLPSVVFGGQIARSEFARELSMPG